MTTLAEIREIIIKKMTRREWISLDSIYTIVEQNAYLDDEDYEPSAPGNKEPKWRRNVRNVLQILKNTPDMEWKRKANYRLL